MLVLNTFLPLVVLTGLSNALPTASNPKQALATSNDDSISPAQWVALGPNYRLPGPGVFVSAASAKSSAVSSTSHIPHNGEPTATPTYAVSKKLKRNSPAKGSADDTLSIISVRASLYSQYLKSNKAAPLLPTTVQVSIINSLYSQYLATTTMQIPTTTAKPMAASTTVAKTTTTTTKKASSAAATTTTKKTTTTTTTTATAKPTSQIQPDSSSSAAAAISAGTLWNEKTSFFSLASFTADVVNQWVWGQSYSTVVQGISKNQWSTAGLLKDGGVGGNNGSAIRANYPAGSRNPSAVPQGGIGFYSSPIDVTGTNNASFSYSVFFPANFNFVKGGKLPGLYGGTKGCSGGSLASDCWSARLMFRTNGMGELYLYAPRDKQVAALCTLPPLSFCNSVYGMSIGRGSWNFTRGGWTDIRQDIWLNTPGVADGGFNIWVNGKLALTSSQVYYRNSVAGLTVNNGTTPNNNITTLIDYDAVPADIPIPNGGFTVAPPSVPIKIIAPTATNVASTSTSSAIPDSTPTSSLPSDYANKLKAKRNVVNFQAEKRATTSTAATPIGILGIMFDTFFGGSTSDYNSPTQQYSYFNSMSLRVRAFNP